MLDEKKRFLLFSVLAIAALPLGSGCGLVRKASDKGHNILEQPGIPASKVLGFAGACPGYALGLPVMVALLPTGLFPGLTYRSSPEHDIEMPLLAAPVEFSGGLCAFLAAWPAWMAESAGGRPRDPLDASEGEVSALRKADPNRR